MILSRVFGALFPLILVLSPVPLGSVHLWNLALWMALLAASFAIVWFPAIAAGEEWPASPAPRWIALYLVFFLLSWAFSRVPARGTAEAFFLASGLLVFAAAAYHCRERKAARSLCIWLASAGAVYSLLGLLQYLGALPKGWWQKPNFISGPFVNHNHFAGLLELSMPLSAALSFYEKETPKKALFFFCALLTGLTLLFTQSRGAWLAVSVALVVMVLTMLSLRYGRMAISGLLLLMMAVAGVSVLFGTRPLEQRADSIRQYDRQDEVMDRFYIWKGGLQAAAARPLLGSGPGTFDSVFLNHRPEGFRGRAGHAHNDYLELLADCGLFAFLACFGLAASILLASFQVMRGSKSQFKSTAAGAALAGLTTILLHGLFDFNFHIPSNWLWCCAIAGMTVAMASKEPAGHREARAVKLFVSALFPLVFLGALVLGVSDYSLQRGKSLLRQGRTEAAHTAFTSAVRMHPFSDEAFDWKGRSAPVKEGMRDFDRAHRLNPLEPYYLYHRAALEAKSAGPAAALPFYRAAVACDPRDAQLRFTVAASMLRGNRRHDRAVEREAFELLASAVRLRPDFASAAYRTAYGYRSDPRLLEEFYGHVPESLEDFLGFMRKFDRWALYRKYLLKKTGKDLARVEGLLTGTAWAEEAVRLAPAYFLDSPGRPFRREGYLFSNGTISREVTLKCARTRVTLKAKGTRALGSYPVLEIAVDGELVDAVTVDSGEFKDYDTVIEAEPGTHTLSIGFVNDRAGGDPPGDRNVWLERVELRNSC